MTTRTGQLLVVHDTGYAAARASLANLLLVAGKGVEVEELDALHVVALIAPADLENSSKRGENG
jgi:hypothetical protein